MTVGCKRLGKKSEVTKRGSRVTKSSHYWENMFLHELPLSQPHTQPLSAVFLSHSLTSHKRFQQSLPQNVICVMLLLARRTAQILHKR